MNTRVTILIGAWVAMWFAFHFGHPVGYLIVVVGFAASVAIAAEDLREDDPVETVVAVAEVGDDQVVLSAAQVDAPVRHTASRRSKTPATRDLVDGGLRPAT